MRPPPHVPLVALILALAACLAESPAPVELIAVPTQSPGPVPNLGPHECNAALLEGELVADDDFGFVVAHADEFTTPVTWPHGFVARDAERRELLDGSGQVIAREGDHVALGGGEGEIGFAVCGEFEVTPAGR